MFDSGAMHYTDDESSMNNIYPEDVDTNLDDGSKATVKLYNPQSGKCMATLKSSFQKTVGEMKEMIAAEFKVPVENINFEFQGGAKQDSIHLTDIEDGSQDDLRFTLRITTEGDKVHKDSNVIEAMTPLEKDSSEKWKNITIVEGTLERKPFLGGYRNKESGVIYHHATMQTLPKGYSPQELEELANKRSRDTQTCQLKSLKVQTSCDSSTQMTKPGLYVSDAYDKEITPSTYETADEVKDKKVAKVVILQKYLRRWLAKNKVNVLRMEREKRIEWEMNERRKEEEEEEEEMKKDKQRRIHPTTKQDFDLLFSSLKKWKKEEEEEINMTLSGAERKAALCMLLDREAELIVFISGLQMQANNENKEQNILKFLNQASAPKTFKSSSNGKNISVSTPEILRADQLKQIYVSLKTSFELAEERLDVLLVLKNTIQEYDSKTSRELLDLINRETNLILIGVNEHHLQGLRSRITTLFLQLTKDPVFNPQAVKCLKIPPHIQTLEQQYKKLLNRKPVTPDKKDGLARNHETILYSSTKHPSVHHEDMSQYRCILDEVIRCELELGNQFSIVFIMQEEDMRYLFENIWESQSSLSLSEDPKELVFVRWVRDEPWSPWNCILLTRNEAQTHGKVDNILKVYGDEFLIKISSKHLMAQSHLSHLQLLIVSQYNNNIKNKTINNNTRNQGINYEIKDENKLSNLTIKSSA